MHSVVNEFLEASVLSEAAKLMLPSVHQLF